MSILQVYVSQLATLRLYRSRKNHVASNVHTNDETNHRSYGQSFHTSIWHVSMTGITDSPHVENVRTKFDQVSCLLSIFGSYIMRILHTVPRVCSSNAYPQTPSPTPSTNSIHVYPLQCFSTPRTPSSYPTLHHPRPPRELVWYSNSPP
jgi:hypothetical protein